MMFWNYYISKFRDLNFMFIKKTISKKYQIQKNLNYQNIKYLI